MQVDQALMALTLLNAELVIQRDEAREEARAANEKLAAVTVQNADAVAAKRAAKRK